VITEGLGPLPGCIDLLIGKTLTYSNASNNFHFKGFCFIGEFAGKGEI